MKRFTLSWRHTNFPTPVLAGLTLHWATGLSDSVGEAYCDEPSDDDEIYLERVMVEEGEHFQAVIGADNHCIQQLNFITSKGRILGPQPLESGQNSLASLLPDFTQPSLVGLVGTCFSYRNVAVLAELQFVYKVAAPTKALIQEEAPVEHEELSSNFVTINLPDISGGTTIVQESPPTENWDTGILEWNEEEEYNNSLSEYEDDDDDNEMQFF